MKIISHVLAVILVLALTACGEQGKGPGRPDYTGTNPGPSPSPSPTDSGQK